MLSQKLFQKTSQSLVISKQMQQSLKILQMTSMELTAYLNNEIQDNPFIELDSHTEESIVEDHITEDIDVSNYWQEENYLRYDNYVSKNAIQNDNSQIQQISLKDHIHEQINIYIKDEKHRFIAYYITDLLDENGYLKTPLDKMAQIFKCNKNVIVKVLDKLKTFDPVGIFASNLSECMKIQLINMNIMDKKIHYIIDNLEAIFKGNLSKNLKTLKIDLKEFHNHLKIIRGLNPFPIRSFNIQSPQSRIADAIIYKTAEGKFHSKINLTSQPLLTFNKQYFDKIHKSATCLDEKKFCLNKLHSSNWLLKSMSKRLESILKVTNQIAIMQEDFLNQGINYLKPMTLSDMSKLVDLSESTICRISNKYLATPNGLFEIKYFFSNSLESSVSENLISTRSVKSKIIQLVDDEKYTKQILSDDAIALKLADHGINISRRTVAKYRDMLKIDPSHSRKHKLNY